MNKLFKTTLLAAMVAGSFSAGAATLTTDAIGLSTEGLELGLTAADTLAPTIAMNVVVEADNPASSTITLTFSDSVDLSSLDVTAVDDTYDDGTADFTNVRFNVGTGGFTFSNLSVDPTANTLSYDVDLGDQMAANSAYSIEVDLDDITAAATVSYVAETSAGVEIETGSVDIATEETQFTVAVEDAFDGLIERTDYTTFTDGLTDTLDLTVTNDTSLYALVTGEDMTFTLEGDFTDIANTELADGDLAGATVADEDTITFTLGNAVLDAATSITAADLTFTNIDSVGDGSGIYDDIPVTGSISLAATLSTLTIADNLDAGEWQLDASVVNVPYLPVGYSNLSSNVEYSNHGTAAAEVQITAFDSEGNDYEGTLADAPAGTITKYSEDEVMDALGITEATKLNITFISDADVDDVSIVPYYKEGESRVQTINDQYKGDDVR
jgi:hypothetical protein